ncbi:hypothetical protein G9F71_003975 [Clostridium sp. FP2]|uniref:hypothetical protein n=1 Tax=Clostridium TaxID=1485 RepID=UPI0013E94A8E|nr:MULTISPECIES: hypothetical protein [Clostridium]MBW9156853.1 hypothetical protein [Clostridium tagluense]MBZ9622016.1 hypothetical protein [Clostridium sp. FP2]WLC66331.1 hypothetical protein KTC93_03645 [Clostridium tagluense]
MNYSYIFIMVAAVGVVGVSVLKSRRRDENYNTVEKTEYAVFMTDTFTKDDAEVMKPIFTMALTENVIREELILCKVLDGDGELTIKDAEGLMIENMKDALKNKAFIESFIYEENCSIEEKLIAHNLKKEISILSEASALRSETKNYHIK